MPADSDPSREGDLEAMDAALDALAMQFENVSIFASRFDPASGYTTSSWRGRGNWHARVGQVREWLVKRETEAQLDARRDAASEEE